MRTEFSTCFRGFLAGAALMLLPAGSGAEPARGPVLVVLENDANVAPDVAAAAQVEVVRLFDRADVRILWVTRVPPPGTRLRVVSLVTWEPREEKMASVLGLTSGTERTRPIRGYVFWRRVALASSQFTAALHNVLAVAIAHELGHMLLPDGAHAAGHHGVPLEQGALRIGVGRAPVFLPETAALMARRLGEEVSSLPGDHIDGSAARFRSPLQVQQGVAPCGTASAGSPVDQTTAVDDGHR